MLADNSQNQDTGAVLGWCDCGPEARRGRVCGQGRVRTTRRTKSISMKWSMMVIDEERNPANLEQTVLSSMEKDNLGAMPSR